MGRVHDTESFFELLQFVADYAPDFPAEDAGADEQLDLDTAFQQLEHGLGLFQDRFPAAKFKQLRDSLKQAHEEFRQGNEFHGAHTIGQLQKQLRKSKR